MPKLHHKIWLFGLLFIMSQSSFALSVGEIKVISTFAQPFLAEINLPSYTADEMESIQIHLASKQQFSERNMEMMPVLNKFHFSVEEKKDGALYIKVYTKDPVKELSISFLLEVTWSGGRIIKAYDILLTPEAITEFWEKRAQEMIAQVEIEMATQADAPPSIQSTITTEMKNAPVIRQATQVASNQTQNTALARNRKVMKTKNGGIEYSPVGRGESLSLIAQRIRPDKNMSINQVMIALFNENRDAFMNNDINRLLAGVTLKISDVNTIDSISKKEAFQLAQQYMKRRDSPEQQPMLAKNEATETAPPELEKNIDAGNRLEISSANEDPIPQEILQQIKNEQIASAEEELKMARQNFETLQSENVILKDRIDKLENELDATAESLFLATIQQETIKNAPDRNSATQQDQNLLLANTELTMAGDEKLSLMQRIEKYQTAISISSATLLSMTILGIRKKDIILDVIHNLKDRLNKSKTDDESQFG